MPRPCPFVSCAYHLIEIGSDGRGIRTPPEFDEDPASTLSAMSDTCALDVADRTRRRMILGGEPLDHATIGQKLGMTRETVKKIEAAAMARLRGEGGGVRAFLAASPIADEDGHEAAAPDLLSLSTTTGWAPLGFD